MEPIMISQGINWVVIAKK